MVQRGSFGVILPHALTVGVQHAQIVHGAGIPRIGGFLVQLGGFGVVLGYTQTVVVQPPQIAHSIGNARIGGLLIQRGSFGKVLGYALTVGVQHAQIVQGAGISRIGGFLVEFGSLGAVLGYTLTVFVQQPQIVHSIGIARIGGFLEQRGSLGVVLGHALTVFIQQPQIDHSIGIARIGALLVQLGSLGVILRHTPAVFIQHRQIDHSIGIARIGALLVQLGGFGVILRHTITANVQHPQNVQPPGKTQIGGILHPRQRRVIRAPLHLQKSQIDHYIVCQGQVPVGGGAGVGAVDRKKKRRDLCIVRVLPRPFQRVGVGGFLPGCRRQQIGIVQDLRVLAQAADMRQLNGNLHAASVFLQQLAALAAQVRGVILQGAAFPIKRRLFRVGRAAVPGFVLLCQDVAGFGAAQLGSHTVIAVAFGAVFGGVKGGVLQQPRQRQINLLCLLVAVNALQNQGSRLFQPLLCLGQV